jgi:hypothetical protein
MADDLTIDGYLVALDGALGRRHDRGDLVDEVEDHLRSAAERAMLNGTPSRRAEAETIERFGDPVVIASLLADAAGLAAVPTRFTRAAGTAAVVTAVAWVAVPVLWWSSQLLERTRAWEGSPQQVWMGGAACLVVAMAGALVLAIGLGRRHGGIGAAGTLSTILAAIALVIGIGGSYFVVGWSLALAVSWAVLADVLISRRIAPRLPCLLLGAAWPTGLVAVYALRAVEFGAPDRWGDHPAATNLGLGLGAVLAAVGVAGLGRWLRSEVIVDDVPSDPLALA